MRIYNTLTREKEELIPQEEGHFKIYACGPTVYNYIHIGNARPICVFEVLRRYLEYRGNKALLNQVWINLIDNAIKFSPQNGKIKLKLHKKKDQVVFQILDNGCGMDEDTKNHIFDRFYQGDSSHTAEGNGIGLTVVEKIVHLHKGQIRVISEAGIGTTFTVNLPIIPPPSAP